MEFESDAVNASLAASITKMQWAKAAHYHNGVGLEEGVDLGVIKRQLLEGAARQSL